MIPQQAASSEMQNFSAHASDKSEISSISDGLELILASDAGAADSRTGFRPILETGKKGIKSETATKVSFVALSEPFFNRLDIFSNARLLKITLMLLFFGFNHYLPSLRASLGRELAQPFQFPPKSVYF